MLNPNKLSLAKVQLALYNWVKNETIGQIDPDHIIWRNQSEPLPGRPCVAMRIMSPPKRVGYQDSILPSTTGVVTIGGQRQMTVSVQVYGNLNIHRPLAMQLALDLNSSLSKTTVLDRLYESGVAVFNQGEPQNLTELVETEYEERSAFDILLGVAENVLDDQGIIEQANITQA